MNKNLLSELQFELNLKDKKGHEFQKYVNELLRYTYGIDFIVPQWGKTSYTENDKGDEGNDGYVKGSGIFFQIYCPEAEYTNDAEVYRRALDKINQDLVKLLVKWNNIEAVKEFIFIFNKDSTTTELEEALSNIAKRNNINAKLYCRTNLKTLFEKLKPEEKQRLTLVYNNEVIFSDDIMFEVCSYINSQECSAEILENGNANFNREEFEKKIAHNNFQQKYSDFLKNGLHSCGGVQAFFEHKEEMQETLKTKLNQKYKELLCYYKDDSNQILVELIRFCLPRTKDSELKTCTGTITHCVYILSYFFHYCDIFLDYVTAE